jgi:TrwC relaxase
LEWDTIGILFGKIGVVTFVEKERALARLTNEVAGAIVTRVSRQSSVIFRQPVRVELAPGILPDVAVQIRAVDEAGAFCGRALNMGPKIAEPGCSPCAGRSAALGLYFDEHLSLNDYYSPEQTAFGQWIGTGSQRLGLKEGSIVSRDDFVALCDNVDPSTGKTEESRRLLTQRRHTERRILGPEVHDSRPRATQ